MNWDRVEGQWKQRRGKAVHHWGKLMNDELAATAGKHEQLVGTLQEKYGIAKKGNHIDELFEDKVQCQSYKITKIKKEEVERNIDESKNIIEETTTIMSRCAILIIKKTLFIR